MDVVAEEPLPGHATADGKPINSNASMENMIENGLICRRQENELQPRQNSGADVDVS